MTNKNFYNRTEVWGKEPEEYQIQVQRDILDILNILSDDIKSILDVGCGDGFITNWLPSGINVVGIDISAEALKYVNKPKINGSVTQIPFQDKSYDLVMANDLIEHLNELDYSAALVEIKRVARRFVLITVPFKENLEAGNYKCESCGNKYHINGHFRSFNIDTAQKMLGDDWIPILHVLSGAEQTYELPEIISYKRQIGICDDSSNTLCPYCLFQNSIKQKNWESPLTKRMEAFLNAILLKSGDNWFNRSELITVFEKKSYNVIEEIKYSIDDSIVDKNLKACKVESFCVNSNKINLRYPSLYYKDFLPRKNPRPYFCAKLSKEKYNQINFKPDDLIKFGFYDTEKQNITFNGEAFIQTNFSIYVYTDEENYKLVQEESRIGNFNITVDKRNMALSEFGFLVAIQGNQPFVLSSITYGEQGISEEIIDLTTNSNARFLQTQWNNVRILLSLPYYKKYAPGVVLFKKMLARETNLSLVKLLYNLQFELRNLGEHNKEVVNQLNEKTNVIINNQLLFFEQKINQLAEESKNAINNNLLTMGHKIDKAERKISNLGNELKLSFNIYRKLMMEESELKNKVLVLEQQLIRSNREFDSCIKILHQQLDESKALIDKISLEVEILKNRKSHLSLIKNVINSFKNRCRALKSYQPVRYEEENLFTPEVCHQDYLGSLNKDDHRNYLMVCHDQDIDRRIIQEAKILEKLGWKGLIIALAFDGNDKLDEDSSIPVHRIGLNKIIPDCKAYRNFNKRQYWLLNYIYNVGHILLSETVLTRLVNLLFRVLSKMNNLIYHFDLILTYRNKTIYHPLPFTRAFNAAANLYHSSIIFAHDLTALRACVEASKVWGARLVYDCHELYPEQKVFSSVQYKMLRKEEKDLINNTDLVIIASHGSGEVLKERYPEVKGRVKVVLNATNTNNLIDPLNPPNKIREKIGIPEDHKIILYQGGITYNRNLDIFLKGFIEAKLPNVHMVFMGPAINDYILRLKIIAGELLDKTIHFTEPVSQKVLLEYTTSADIGVIPYPPSDLNSLSAFAEADGTRLCLNHRY